MSKKIFMSHETKLKIDQRTDHSIYIETTDKNGDTLTVYVDSSTGENIINVYGKNYESFFSYYLGKKNKDTLKDTVTFPKRKLSTADKTLLNDSP